MSGAVHGGDDASDALPSSVDGVAPDAPAAASPAEPPPVEPPTEEHHPLVFVAGVDGGGSKTRVLVADGDGRTLAEAEGPGSAVRAGNAEHSASVIAETVRRALAEAGLGDDALMAVAVGAAGVGREGERLALRHALESHRLAEELSVAPDATIALDDAFGDGPGVLLIAGTGSVAFARGPDGAFARAGGWGPVLGDEGSGMWLGRRALNAACAAADGREPDTALLPAVLTALELDDASGLVAWAARATAADFAALAPVVARVAAAGDARAGTLLHLAVEELALHVRTLARRLFADERAAVPVAMAGGLLATRSSPLRKRLEQRLKAAVPGAQVRAEPVDPARGAVRGALRLLGAEIGVP